MEQNPYIFRLSNVIEYTVDGDFQKTAEIVLRGPSMDEFDLSGRLSQLVFRAMTEAQTLNQAFKSLDADTIKAARDAAAEKKRNDPDEDTDADFIRMIMMSSERIQITEVANLCKRLFVKVGTYDGKHPLRETVFRSMTVEDFSNMMAGYIANFISPSLF